MSSSIDRVAVIGAGTMGAGIAGLCASHGRDVVLLDVTTEAAQAGIDRLCGGKRPVLNAEQAARISTGTIDDDLDKLASADWICEAVVENLQIKRELFSKLENVRADGSILSTNTSGIPLRDIYADMPARMQSDIAVTHFFNPPHIMQLVELVPGTGTSADVMRQLTSFLGDELGKGVVHAKDTVNFIGNRIGCFWMLAGLHKARDTSLTMETIDALMSKPVGLPPTGLYGLIDLIGLDVMDMVGKNLTANLPADDIGRRFAALPEGEAKLLASGQLGRKTGGGFYKMTRDGDGGKQMHTFDLKTASWRDQQAASLSASHQSIETLLYSDDAEGKFSWDLMSATLGYSSALVPQISDDIVNVDRAMRWGFNWSQGPFELLDQIGARKFAERYIADGRPAEGMLKVLLESGGDSFYRNDGTEYLDTSGAYQPVAG